MEFLNSKATAAAALGAAGWQIGGQLWIFILFTVIAILFDYATGLMAGRRSKEGLVSKKAAKGLEKKLGILFLLGLGLFLDGAIHFMVAKDFFDIPFELPIAHIVTLWIIITEAISICENLQKLGVQIPRWIVKTLRKAEKKMDQNDETEDKP